MNEGGRTAEVTYRRADEADLPRCSRCSARRSTRTWSRPGRRRSPTGTTSPRPTGTTCGTTASASGSPRPSSSSSRRRGRHARSDRPSGRRLGQRPAARRLVVPQQPVRAAGGAGPRRRRAGCSSWRRRARRRARCAPPSPTRCSPSRTRCTRAAACCRARCSSGSAGEPRPGLRPPRLGSLEPEPLTTASIPDLREIDAAGERPRPERRPRVLPRATSGRRGWLFRRAGRPVAYVMVRPDGWVGPAASVREPDM